MCVGPVQRGEAFTMVASPNQISILTFDETCPKLRIIERGGTAAAIVWPGVGARFRTMHYIDLAENGSTISFRHGGEAVYYVKQGTGAVMDADNGTSNEIIEGSMVFIEPGTGYRFKASSGGIVLLGGPCPADASLYEPA